MRRRWILTVLLVAAGIGIGAGVGGVVGLFLGGFIGYLLGRVSDLRSRLDEIAEAAEQARRYALSVRREFPPGEPIDPGEQPATQRVEPDPQPTADPDSIPQDEPEPPRHPRRPPERRLSPHDDALLSPFPWIDAPTGEHRAPVEPTPPPPVLEPPVSVQAGAAPPGPPDEPVAGEADSALPEWEGFEPAEPPGVDLREPVSAYAPPPSLGRKLADAAKTWLTTGNAPVKVGALILLVGVGLLIREASRRGIFTLTIEVRLIAVAAFALVLGAMGWRQRRRRPIYGRSLQGAAIAALYLTTYAAFEVYDLLPAAAAAAAVILVTIGAGVLAVTQDARVLAVLGIIGGFLAPVLSYTRPDDYVVVFSFYTVLSVAIVGVAWFKTWPSLNLLGLAFNFGIATFWLLRRYAEEDWPSLQPFIATFVLIYMVLPVVFAIREAPNIKGPWTAPLVFGTPFLGLGLQQLIIGHTARGVAVSALVLAGLHVALYVGARRLGSKAGELTDAYAALTVVFAAIAVPLWLDAYFTTIAWVLQGGVLLWFGCRRSRIPVVATGALLQVLAAVAFALHLSDALPYPDGRLVILNDYFAAGVLLAAVGLVSGRLLHRAPSRLRLDPLAVPLALAWGGIWWLAAGLLEIAYQVPSWPLPASFIFVVASCGAAVRLGERARWPQLTVAGVVVVPILALVVLSWLLEAPYHLDRHGGAAVLAACGLASGFLFQRCSNRSELGPSFGWWALVWGIGWWLAGGLLEIAYRLPSWQLPMALGFVACSLGIAAWAAERARWHQLNALGVLILPTLAVVLGLSIVEMSHPLGRYGWAAWPLALAAYYWFLRIRDDVLGVLLATLHVGGFLVLAALIGAEVHWQVGRVAVGSWAPVASFGAVLVLAAGALWGRRSSRWPLGPHRRLYVAACIGPVLGALMVGLFIANLLLDGDPPPFLFLPVLNPLEMLTAALVAVAFSWRRVAIAEGDQPLRGLLGRRWAPTLAPAGVIVATMSVARTIHHWRDEPWEFVALARSTELQAALSITWAVIALSTMVVAVRLDRRAVWVAGASFMGIVVAKLFFVDLSSLGAVTRVVSFLGVGALLVVVGYFAPVVPAAKAEEAEDRTGTRTLGS